MSFLPKLRNTSAPSRVEEVAFFGLDRRHAAGGGYFSDVKGMTSYDFPFISSRDKRYISKLSDGYENVLGVLSDDELYYVIGNGAMCQLYCGDKRLMSWPTEQSGDRIIVRNGRYVFVFPDKVYFRFKDENAIEEYKNTHLLYGTVGEGYVRIAGSDAVTSSQLYIRAGDDEEKASITDLADHDCIKLWAYSSETGEQREFHNLSVNEGVTISEADRKVGGPRYIIIEDEIFSASISNTTYNGYITKTINDGTASAGTFIKVGFEHTHPRELDEKSGEFAQSAECCEIFTDDVNDYFVVTPRGVSTPYSFNAYDFIEKTYAEGIDVRFSSESLSVRPVFPESAVISSQSADIEGVGVRKFYHGNNYFLAAYIAFPKGTFTIDEDSWIESKEDGFKYVMLRDDDDKKAYIYANVDYPTLSDAIILNGRLWGYDDNSCIYASSLGKPYILSAYKGLSTDSWTLDTGFNEGISGVYSYAGTPIFFTEKRIVKVYGSLPSEFRTAETQCYGLKKGSCSAIAECGGILFYLDSTGAICSYTGSYPVQISQKLNCEFSGGKFTSDGRYVYCLCDSHLYLFDVENKIWLLDGKSDARLISSFMGELYLFRDGFIESSCDEHLYFGFERFNELPITSFVEFPVNDEGLFNKKKLKKVLFKINAEEGTSLKVEVRETDSPEYRRIFERVIEGGDEVLTIPVDCKRTLGYSVRISGKGKWRLEGIMRRVSIGSYKS